MIRKGSELVTKLVQWSWRRIPAYPILFGLFAVLSLLSANIGQISISDSYRSLVLASILGLVMFGASWLLTRERHSAGLLAFAIMLVFFSYGHVYSSLERVHILGIQLGRHRYMIPTSLALLTGAAAFAFRRKSRLAEWTPSVNLVVGLAVIMPVVSLFYQNLRHGLVEPAIAPVEVQHPSLAKAVSGEAPDIYYIIVDTYERSDNLKKFYGYDNSDFESFLQQNGFYIAGRSQANFLFTHLSMTSSLNMNYMQTLFPNYSSGDKLPIRNNLVREQLESIGYKTVGFATGWDATEWFDSDYFYAPNMGAFAELQETKALNRFEGILIETTALQVFVDWGSLNATPVGAYIRERLADPFHIQRSVVLAEFDHLQQVPRIPGPKFVFVHILPPHGPHLFGPNGEEVEHTGAFTLLSGLEDKGQLYDKEYLDELTYVNKRLEEDIDIIINTSRRPVVIILQSDHGSGHGLDWSHPTEGTVTSRIGIMNAYYVPEQCKQRLYPSITPVNSFRLLFNCEFGLSMELLPDRTYYGYDTYVPVDELLRSLAGN